MPRKIFYIVQSIGQSSGGMHLIFIFRKFHISLKHSEVSFDEKKKQKTAESVHPFWQNSDLWRTKGHRATANSDLPYRRACNKMPNVTPAIYELYTTQCIRAAPSGAKWRRASEWQCFGMPVIAPCGPVVRRSWRITLHTQADLRAWQRRRGAAYVPSSSFHAFPGTKYGDSIIVPRLTSLSRVTAVFTHVKP